MLNRKADTRHKIQLGGLVIKAGLSHLSTAELLGLLLEAAELLTTDEEGYRKRWRLLGDLTFTRTAQDTANDDLKSN